LHDIVASPSRQLLWDALRVRLRELGYREGTDVLFELRSADGHVDRLDALAADLARQRVDVIVTASTPAALAAKRATANRSACE
jgi:putative ABC transport system substrate-binding protein